MIRSFASATVEGSAAQLNLQANVPLSQAGSSVTIKMSSGKATAKVSAQEPPTKKKPKRAAQEPPTKKKGKIPKRASPSSMLQIKGVGDQY